MPPHEFLNRFFGARLRPGPAKVVTTPRHVPEPLSDSAAAAMATLAFRGGGASGTPAPKDAAAPPGALPPARWIAPGETVTVRGFQVPGPVYVGSRLPADPSGTSRSTFPAPCLVDPSLPVGTPPAPGMEQLGYWPSYSDISPPLRAGYLRWLSSGGQRDGSSNLGYAFLFLYGIERRLLADQPGGSEADFLVATVRGLRTTFRSSASFGNYASKLVDEVALRRTVGTPSWPSGWSPLPGTNQTAVGAAIGILAARREPVPFTLAWRGWKLFAHPSLADMLPSCATEAEHLAREMFAAAFPDGICLWGPDPRPLQLQYLPAAKGLVVPPAVHPSLVVDPATLDWGVMRAFAASVHGELAPLARVRSKPNRNALDELSAMPVSLADSTAANPAAAAMSAAVRTGLAGCPDAAVIQVSDIVSWFGLDGDKLSAKQLGQLSKVAAALGFGMFPDPVSGKMPRECTVVAVYASAGQSRPGQDAVEPGAALLVTALTATLDAPGLAAAAATIASSFAMDGPASARLLAFAAWKAAPGSGKVSLKAAANAVPEDGHAQVARAAAMLASSVPSAMQALETVMDSIGQPRTALYAAALHPATADSPVLVSAATPGSYGRRLPPRQEPQPGAGSLDTGAITRIQAETRAAAAALAAVWADDGEDAIPAALPAPEVAPGGDVPAWPGLGPAHARLLSRLVGREEWSPEDYEAAARGEGLRPAGALEELNEWSLDTLGEQVIEDGDPMIVNVRLVAGT